MNAWNKTYQIDMFPSIWEHVHALLEKGIAVATIQVLHEIERQDDVFHQWCKERKELFVDIDEAILDHLPRLMKKYPRIAAKGSDRNMADPWVIALAQCYDPVLAVVTEEGTSRNQNNPKIPLICDLEKIRPVNFNTLLRETKWRERS